VDATLVAPTTSLGSTSWQVLEKRAGALENSVLTEEAGRGGPEQPPEVTGQVALVGEANIVGDLGD
jgi:hypothetical protein